MEDFLRACHTTVKESGAEELAGKMCMAHVSLLQRSNPDNAGHHLTIEHLFGILLHTGDMRPLSRFRNLSLKPLGSRPTRQSKTFNFRLSSRSRHRRSKR